MSEHASGRGGMTQSMGSVQEREDVARRWVVVLADPATGEIESYGPYVHEQALRLQRWCWAELDVDDLSDVVVTVAPLR